MSRFPFLAVLTATLLSVIVLTSNVLADVTTISSSINAPLGYNKGGYVEIQIQAGPALSNGSRTGLIATVYNAAGQSQGSVNAWDSDGNGGTVNPSTSNYTASNTGFGFNNSAVSYGLSVNSAGAVNVYLGTGAEYNGSFSYMGNKTISNPGFGFNQTVTLGNLWSVLGGNVNWATYTNAGNGSLNISSINGSSANDTFAAGGTATLPGYWRTKTWKPALSNGYSKDMIKTGDWGTKTITFGSFVANGDAVTFGQLWQAALAANADYDALNNAIIAFNDEVDAYLNAEYASYEEQLAAYEALNDLSIALQESEDAYYAALNAYNSYATYGNARNTAGIDNTYVVAGLAIADVANAQVLPPAPTPEPATMLILGLGIAGLGIARRRMVK